ncbi:MAG: site-specific DNA-methyltransferase [Bacteroidetes bacterium]|nr:site-specific DNA-methyltransferase [Bacteroidota bacterium]
MELNKIYTEDCLQTMSKMPENYIDLIITSPPYDDIRNYNGYKFEFEKIANEIKRILKIGGMLVWVVGDKTENGSETGTSFRQALYFKEIGLNIHDTMIYYKNNPMPTTGNRYHQHFEYMFAISKGNPKTFNPIKEDTKYKGLANMKNRGTEGSINYKKVERTQEKKIGNVFFYSVGGGISTKDKIAYEHPAIFPEQLVKDQILSWSNELDIIYDPFMGSGTTAKIAQLNNRQWVGSEISSQYVEIAEQRLKENFSQNLFLNGFS